MKRNSWILTYIILIIIQVLLDGLLSTSIYCTIVPFLFIILTLPYRCGTLPTLLLGFAAGLLVDLMGNGVVGLNAAAMTVVAFCRQGLLQMIAGSFIIDNTERPDLYSLGYIKIIGYSALCSLIYLTVFVLVEAGGFSDFLVSLGRISLSTVINCILLTVVFTICGQRRRL